MFVVTFLTHSQIVYHAIHHIISTFSMICITVTYIACLCSCYCVNYMVYLVIRPISQTVFMLSIAINRAEHVCATVIIKHNYMLMCNHKIVINIMLCLLNSTGHI